MGVTHYVADAVVTADEDGHIHRPGAIAVDGGRITWVGPAGERPTGADDVVVRGGLLMPGLVNTHAHSPMSLLRGAGDGLPLDRWLREVVWPREAQMTDDDVYWGMRLGCDEMLRAGVTTTCEMYLHGRPLLAAVRDCGMRCVLTSGIFDLPGAGPGATWQQTLADALELHREFDDPGGRIRIGLGPHSAYLLPPEALTAVAQAAAETGALVQIHLSETKAEGAPIEEVYGCSATALLARLGMLGPNLLAAHAVWLSPEDLALLAEHRVAVAHCPQSNGKLGSGVAPVAQMLASGLRVGLGTDGPASNDNLDLWEELRLAPVLARAVLGDAAALSTRDALHLATRGGAEALGLDTGSLAVGRRADFIRLDAEDAALTPVLEDPDIVSMVVWSASSRLVTDVWVDGVRVVADRCATLADGREARAEAVRRADRLRVMAAVA
jgi:5-methylthioadenosine/S-adenosylhomocysteine deaminase